MEECAHDEHHGECRPIGVLWVQVGASGTGPLSVLRAHGVCVRRWVSEPGHLYVELGLPLTNAAFGAARRSTATSPRIRAGDLGVRHHSPRGAGQQLSISVLAGHSCGHTRERACWGGWPVYWAVFAAAGVVTKLYVVCIEALPKSTVPTAY